MDININISLDDLVIFRQTGQACWIHGTALQCCFYHMEYVNMFGVSCLHYKRMSIRKKNMFVQ